jgi:hypothetical protein
MVRLSAKSESQPGQQCATVRAALSGMAMAIVTVTVICGQEFVLE